MIKRVLIIDDEANIRQMMRLALETEGYMVGEASSGAEALAILGNDSSWDVVLLDQKMPVMTGTDLLPQIMAVAPSARVIMVTAFASVELAVEAMKLGATDFVRKPMTPDILRSAVAAAIAKEEKADHLLDEKRLALGHSRDGTVTMNGFTILRASNLTGALPQRPDECRFIVRDSRGQEQAVIVEIDYEAIRAGAPRAGHLPLEKSFWTEQAESFLSAFLWNDRHIPSRKLTLKGVERGALERAVRGSPDKDTESRPS